MPVALPIEDAYIDGFAPQGKPGQTSITQRTLEQVMEADFPTVACLGIEAYCERLLEVEYTDGTKVFYLDWVPPTPGYVVVYIEPWTTSIDDDGGINVEVKYYRGPEAAKRAEQLRRLIPPGEIHS